MSYARRVINERIRYKNEYEDKLGCWLTDYDDNNMTFVKFFNDYIVLIEINFPKEYPFRPPAVKINNIDYMDLLIISESWKFDILVNKKCLCCSTLLCRNNWHACANIVTLLTEIIDNLELKLRFNEIAHVKKIKEKYLINDIPLEQYL
jgi:ubiquitin-protein ligase